MAKISLVSQVIDLKFIYVVDTNKIKSNVKQFFKIYLRSWDTASTIWNIYFSFSHKWEYVDAWNFQSC